MKHFEIIKSTELFQIFSNISQKIELYQVFMFQNVLIRPSCIY